MSLRWFSGVCVILSMMILIFSSLPAKAEFKVYDADNQYLGIYLYGGTSLAVYNTDKVVLLKTDESLSPKGKYAYLEDFMIVYYKENGCSGDPYVHSSSGNYTNVVAKIPGDDTAYIVNTNSTAEFTHKSYIDRSGGDICRDFAGTFDRFYFGLSPVTLPFSIPIKLPYRFEHVDSGIAPKAKVVVIPLGD